MSLNLQVNSVYTFNTRAPGILGAVIKNARLLMTASFEVASKFENVKIKYEQVLPVVQPFGAPSSPINVLFHQFLTESGEKIFVAEPWIDNTSLEVVTNLNFSVNVVNATLSEKNAVRQALLNIGVSFTMT